jgi:hypothetical protein
MRSLILALLLVSTSYAQMDAKVLVAFSGIKTPIIVGDMILGEQIGDIKPVHVGYVTVTTKAANVEFSASDIARKEASYLLASDLLVDGVRTLTYLITTPGDIWVEATCIDFDQKIFNRYKANISITAPKPPEPPIPPTPDVPADPFNNIGQRVAEWTKGNPNNKAIGQLYLDASNSLKDNLSLTINQASANLITNLRASPQYTNYEKFKEGLNADAASRPGMTRGVLIDYWKCIALGFGVKN